MKTKITTPLRRKKEKRLGNWEDHVFMSTFRKMEKETRWQNKHWWRSNYFVTSFYVFHIFHSMLNVPILHGVACVKSRTTKEQSTTEAEHYVEFCSSSVSLRRKKKLQTYLFSLFYIKSGDNWRGMQLDSSPKIKQTSKKIPKHGRHQEQRKHKRVNRK